MYIHLLPLQKHRDDDDDDDDDDDEVLTNILICDKLYICIVSIVDSDVNLTKLRMVIAGPFPRIRYKEIFCNVHYV